MAPDDASDLVFEPVKPAATAPDPLRLRAPEQALVSQGGTLDKLLKSVIQEKASDLLLIAGLPPIYRINGRLLRMEDHGPLDGGEIGPDLPDPSRHQGAAGPGGAGLDGLQPQPLPLRGGDRRGLAFPRQRPPPARRPGRGGARASRGDPDPRELNLPPTLAELVKPTRGLVLVCGPTGSGKSSTLAALVGEINRTRAATSSPSRTRSSTSTATPQSLIEQVEVGRDAPSFAAALRAALRQDPDVILVGEMRDLETVATALTAAETGHLILSTLHTNDVAQAVHRIVDVFPPRPADADPPAARALPPRHRLQQLVPRADGAGRVPAVELLLANHPVRHHIRSDNLQKLYNEITLGKRQGMISMEESLARLVRTRTIDVEEARVRASHPESSRRCCGGDHGVFGIIVKRRTQALGDDGCARSPPAT